MQQRTILTIFTPLVLLVVAAIEAFVPTAYMPTPDDVPTIGYGTTSGVKLGDKITEEKARTMLQNELQNKFATPISKCLNVPMYQHEFDAVVMFGYNVGVGGVCNTSVGKYFRAGEYEKGCMAMLNFNKQRVSKYAKTGKYKVVWNTKHTQKYIILPGLEKRRKAEVGYCLGDQSALPKIIFKNGSPQVAKW